MKIVYVNECGCIHYASAIVSGYKTIETRTKNTLKNCVNELVLIARTKKGYATEIIGEAIFSDPTKVYYNEFRTMNMYNKHIVPPYSKFDCAVDGFKWCYPVVYSKKYSKPIAMPDKVINHGRAYCEI